MDHLPVVSPQPLHAVKSLVNGPPYSVLLGDSRLPGGRAPLAKGHFSHPRAPSRALRAIGPLECLRGADCTGVLAVPAYPLLEGRRHRFVPPAAGDPTELLADCAGLPRAASVPAPPTFDRVFDEGPDEQRSGAPGPSCSRARPGPQAPDQRPLRPGGDRLRLRPQRGVAWARQPARGSHLDRTQLLRECAVPPRPRPLGGCRGPSSCQRGVAEPPLPARTFCLQCARGARRLTPPFARDAGRGVQGGQVPGPRSVPVLARSRLTGRPWA